MCSSDLTISWGYFVQLNDRIDKDDYGFCDQCGVEIGIRRLEARPTATLCIDCKTLAEIRERQTGI